MKRVFAVLIKAVVLIAYLIIAQALYTAVDNLSRQTFHMMPSVVCFFLIPILFGMLLRVDVFFEKGVRLRPDWPSLLIIGLPCLILTSSTLLMFTGFANVPLPGFMSFLWGNTLRQLAGVASGYTLINGLFRAESKG